MRKILVAILATAAIVSTSLFAFGAVGTDRATYVLEGSTTENAPAEVKLIHCPGSVYEWSKTPTFEFVRYNAEFDRVVLRCV